ncbi:hypothetical protein, unlikely [Trypanosoma congolense IL3000]|uniref:Uncharacterized protein n=1 Tax=Trypanosoma congolense (strain IL3000) TaxID=1068625 RepID=F9WFH1_TRYCI|nr:hypothetical protein, unlikely [Trypanosoma congolense IL3000]
MVCPFHPGRLCKKPSTLHTRSECVRRCVAIPSLSVVEVQTECHSTRPTLWAHTNLEEVALGFVENLHRYGRHTSGSHRRGDLASVSSATGSPVPALPGDSFGRSDAIFHTGPLSHRGYLVHIPVTPRPWPGL